MSAATEQDVGTMRQVARWCAWGVLLLPALAVTAFSAFFNAAYGFYLGGNDALTPLIFAAGLVATDALKVVLPALGGLAWRSGYRFFAVLLWTICSGFFALSITSNFVVHSLQRTEIHSNVEADIFKLEAARQQRAEKKVELDRLDDARPAAVLASLVRNKELDPLWRRSAGCTDVTRMDSRRFCHGYNGLVAELAGATRAGILRQELGALDRSIAAMTTAKTIAGVDPDLSLVMAVFGIDSDAAAAGRTIIFALFIELAATFGVSAAWLARPRRWRPSAVQAEPQETPPERPKSKAPGTTPTLPDRAAKVVPITSRKAAKTPTAGTPGKTNGRDVPVTVGATAIAVVPEPNAGISLRDCDEGCVDIFISALVIRRKGARVAAADLFQAYCSFCRARAWSAGSQQAFGARLRAAGLAKVKSCGRMTYIDVALKPV